MWGPGKEIAIGWSVMWGPGKEIAIGWSVMWGPGKEIAIGWSVMWEGIGSSGSLIESSSIARQRT